jgi:two-component system OmpR family sensor kinase
VEISVKDDGPGIPADQLEHIFERFTRGDAGLTQRVGGTGLGLAISKSLVELHGGSIGAESAPGEGSTFSIVLPAEAS